MRKQIYYTLIGSRKTPKDIMELMIRFAEKGCHFNYTGRSGSADGSDECLEIGVKRFLSLKELPESFLGSYIECYLPWKDFNGRDSSMSGYYTLPWMDNKHEAEKIASEIHPAWDKCSQGAKKLHSRNVYQLLGQDLNTPSRFILCWAEPKYNDRLTEEVKGGSNTAIMLGIKHKVEVINLYFQEDRERVEKWLN